MYDIIKYTKIILENPNEARAYFDRAWERRYLKDYKGADEDFAKAKELRQLQ